MKYDNQFFLEHHLDKTAAVIELYEGRDVWAVPECGCPAMPDAVLLLGKDFEGNSLERINDSLGSRFQCFAASTQTPPVRQAHHDTKTTDPLVPQDHDDMENGGDITSDDVDY